jgi:hypothetical protein
MSAIWESANWTRQFGIRQFGMLPFLQVKKIYQYRNGYWMQSHYISPYYNVHCITIFTLHATHTKS